MLRRLRIYRDASKEAERLARELETTRAELAKTRGQLARWSARTNRAEAEPFDASKLVWIFGAGRSGTTWLSSILGELPGFGVWFEPRIGKDLDMAETNTGKHFVFSPRREPDWRGPLRSLILKGAATRYPQAEWVVVKEPGTSSAAVIMRAVPSSRLLLLVRDPRDVAASWLDATKEGGWRARGRGKSSLEFVRLRALGYKQAMSGALQAYRNHSAQKSVVRYEDLKEDTLDVLSTTLDELAIEVNGLPQAVEKHSWENIPEEKKGKGNFYRKATPGGVARRSYSGADLRGRGNLRPNP